MGPRMNSKNTQSPGRGNATAKSGSAKSSLLDLIDKKTTASHRISKAQSPRLRKSIRLTWIRFDCGSCRYAIGAAAEPSRRGAGVGAGGCPGKGGGKERGEPVQVRCRVVHSPGFGRWNPLLCPSPHPPSPPKTHRFRFDRFDRLNAPRGSVTPGMSRSAYRMEAGALNPPRSTLRVPSARRLCQKHPVFALIALIHSDQPLSICPNTVSSPLLRFLPFRLPLKALSSSTGGLLRPFPFLSLHLPFHKIGRIQSDSPPSQSTSLSTHHYRHRHVGFGLITLIHSDHPSLLCSLCSFAATTPPLHAPFSPASAFTRSVGFSRIAAPAAMHLALPPSLPGEVLVVVQERGEPSRGGARGGPGKGRASRGRCWWRVLARGEPHGVGAGGVSWHGASRFKGAAAWCIHPRPTPSAPRLFTQHLHQKSLQSL